jgi:hypothetical protein
MESPDPARDSLECPVEPGTEKEGKEVDIGEQGERMPCLKGCFTTVGATTR